MENHKIYEDIARRTDGDIYIGVVGPVRTGKSSFVKRFMESMVLPGIENDYYRERARDELPQAGSGRTVMTAEPKFVPEEAVELNMGNNAKLSVRLIDCVGYMVDGAIGQTEDGLPRMVNTPWFDYEIPMSEAAEYGTKKVITEHSTIGIVITTDGTVTDISRENYIHSENRVIEELKEINKPFIVLVNSAYPMAAPAQAVCDEITQKHGVTCMAINCQTVDENDVVDILKGILYEFPVEELGFHLPVWVDALPHEHPIKSGIYSHMLKSAENMYKIRDIDEVLIKMKECKDISYVHVGSIQLGCGIGEAFIELPRELFYQTLGEQSGFEIANDGDLLKLLSGLSHIKREYDKVSSALESVRETGYGIVMPGTEELTLEAPEIIKQSGKYGVMLKASAPSIHMIRADIETEVNPIMGSERQSEDLVHYLLSEFENEPEKIWSSNIFGKSLHELVNEGLTNKLKRMPEDARGKLRETLQRIINEGSGGLICIIL